MGVSGGGKVLKYLVFIFNFLFFLIGVALLGIGIYAKVGKSEYIDLTEELSDASKYVTAGNLLIAVGCIILVVAFFGCCGAVTENACMVLIFFILLFVIFILELAACIVGYTKRDDLKKEMETDFLNAMNERYSSTKNDSAVNKIIDNFQSRFECCGYNNFADWRKSNYTITTGKLPASCCIKGVADCPTNDASKLNVYQQEGCFKEVVDWFKDNMYAIGSAAIAFAIVQILGLVFSMMLYRSIRQSGEMA